MAEASRTTLEQIPVDPAIAADADELNETFRRVCEGPRPDSDDRLRAAPIGTLAPAFNGGAWLKTVHGWQWNGHTATPGSTFPRPGGDWMGELIPPAVAADRTVEEMTPAFVDWLFANCKMVLTLPGFAYPVEHNPHAKKDGRTWIEYHFRDSFSASSAPDAADSGTPEVPHG